MANTYTTELRMLDDNYHLHPFTDHKAQRGKDTLIIDRGEGCYVWDTEGNKYLDGLAGLVCVNVGYGRDELVSAASEQMKKLSYFNSFFGCTNPPAVKLAEKLVELTPDGFNQVFFVNDGSEANDTAIRLVRHYWSLVGKPEKRIIIGRENGYHGSTLATAQMGGMAPMHDHATSLPGFGHVMAPHHFKNGRGLTEQEFGLKAAVSLEEKILGLGAENIAAFVAEPLQGAGGGIMPPENYWAKIQEICKKYDVLLVVDEVVTGFGRTGAWFGCETYNINNADIICLGKGITSGYVPLGAVMVGDRIAETLVQEGGEFYHGFTYSGHPLSCAVAMENIAVLERDNIVERVAKETAPHFKRRMMELLDSPVVGEIRVQGLVAAVELVKDKNTLEAFLPEGEIVEMFSKFALKRGIITRPIGETVIMTPPLVITIGELDTLVDSFKAALKDFEAWVFDGAPI